MERFLAESKVRRLEEEGEANKTEPKFGDEAASPIMAGLYSARSCRPDLSVPTLRLARRVTRWNVADDAKIQQYLGYIKGTAGARLLSQLDTKDFATAVSRMCPDADHAGDAGIGGQSSGGY